MSGTRQDSGATAAPPRWRLLLPLIGMVQVLAVAAVAAFFVPHFVDLFRHFGAELPHITRLLVATYRWWPLLALLVPAIWLVWPQPSRDIAALVLGVILALLLSAFGIWACYTPLLHLAAHAA